MQPCFTPAKQLKASVNLLSILTADLSFEYMDIKTSRKRPCTPSFLSLSNSFCRGIQSKAFLKSTKHEKSKFWRYVPVNSAHPPPPRAIPGHLTRVKLRTVGNLTQNEARPVGHLTFVSKRLSAVGNKRISQFFDSAREPRVICRFYVGFSVVFVLS